MSALPEALPLALAAGVYPPALLLLLLLLLKGKHPHSLVLAYYGGAAIVTTGAGLVALAIFNGAGLTAKSSQTASGWTYIISDCCCSRWPPGPGDAAPVSPMRHVGVTVPLAAVSPNGQPARPQAQSELSCSAWRCSFPRRSTSWR
jgi:hypothetical protein